MSNETIEIWQRESERLQSARDRYLESLEAIQELADFATEHVVKLDKKRGSGVIITPGLLKSREAEPGSPTFEGFMNFVASIVAEDENKPDEEGLPDPFELFSNALEAYKASLPEGTDISALEGLITEKKPTARLGLLLSSLLIAAVSDFEVLFSSIAGFFFHVRPEALRSQDTRIAWSEIESYPSLEALRSHFIDERVNQLMWGGFDDWMKWLENQLKINYMNASLDPSETSEVFQRRHIIVHNGGLVSAQYLAKVAGASTAVTIGSPLPVDFEYLNHALDRLTVVGVSLTYLVLRKLCPTKSEHERIDKDTLGLIRDLLYEQRWKAVEVISSIVLPRIEHDYERCSIQVSRWFAIKRLSGRDAIAEEVSRWDVSALQKIFELAQKMLLDDPDTVVMAEEMVKRGEIDQQTINNSPWLWDLREQIDRLLAASESEP